MSALEAIVDAATAAGATRVRPVVTAWASAVLLPLASAALVLAAAPPFDVWPLAPVALAPLLWSLRTAAPLGAFGRGWLCGLAVTAGGQAWLVDVLARFAGTGAATGAAALVALGAYQGVVLGGACAGVALLRGRVSPLVAAPLLLAALEAWVPFLFPWYLAITAWRAWPLVQLAELGGPPAVSAYLALTAAIVVAGLDAVRTGRPARGAAVAALVALALLGVGLGRALQVAHARAAAPALRVGLVQPDQGLLPLAERQARGQAVVDALRAASEDAGRRGAELVVWPESAFPYLVDRGLEREYAAAHPWALRGAYRGRLLFGALTHDFGGTTTYNSATLVAADGHVAGRADKVQLLAFGEFVPLADRFPAWAARVRARLPEWPSITPGDARRVLVDGALRVAALICYEDLLPAHVHALARQGAPTLLVTVANHAWFGDGAAARQALALASFRAVETRRDLVRATSTGVSSVTDALGRTPYRGPLTTAPRAMPTVAVEEVRLLDGPALAPRTAAVFPFCCVAALVAAALAGRSSRAPRRLEE